MSDGGTGPGTLAAEPRERRRRGARLAGQQRTALASIAAAAVLVALKLGTGLATGSLGLISAGIESSGDVIAAVLTFFAVRLGARPADPEHPYGHRRAENLAALGEAVILVAGGTFVVVEAIGRLAEGGERLEVRWYVFAVIGLALVIDVSRIVISLRTARHYSSAALYSNAMHFGADLAGSLAVLAGLVLVAVGVESGDTIAALVVAAIIFAAALRLVLANADVLMDRAPVDAEQAARSAIVSLGPALELRRLRLRESGGRYFADAVVAVPPGRAVVEGHATADEVEHAVQEALPGTDVVVHVEPQRRGLDLRDRVLAAALADPDVREAHDITIYRHGGRASVALHLKLADDLSLADAHRVAERVEQSVHSFPQVDDVQTHLEPLERPLTTPESAAVDASEAARVSALVRERTGRGPHALRLIATDAGLVIFLTVRVDPDAGLAEAHELAGELEEAVRRGRPDIADVVVHTEPGELA
jgi:cation diffusion facilitator family transporter